MDGFEEVEKDKVMSEKYDTNYMGERTFFWLHIYAVFHKRWKNARRDWKTFVCQMLIPSIFILMGLWFIDIQWWEDQPYMVLGTQSFVFLLLCNSVCHSFFTLSDHLCLKRSLS